MHIGSVLYTYSLFMQGLMLRVPTLTCNGLTFGADLPFCLSSFTLNLIRHYVRRAVYSCKHCICFGIVHKFFSIAVKS